MDTNNEPTKRVRSEKTDESSNQDIASNGDKNLLSAEKQSKANQVKKKLLKVTTGKNLEEMFQPIKVTLQQPNKLLNYEQFQSLQEKAHGSPNTQEIASEYTDNTISLISYMKELYPLLNDRYMKNRFTRISKKLNRIPETDLVSTLNSPYPTNAFKAKIPLEAMFQGENTKPLDSPAGKHHGY